MSDCRENGQGWCQGGLSGAAVLWQSHGHRVWDIYNLPHMAIHGIWNIVPHTHDQRGFRGRSLLAKRASNPDE